MKRLKKNFTALTEIPALNLLGQIISARDVAECLAVFTTAYGKNFALEISERVNLLFRLCLEDHWTNERFIQTAKWIVKNRPYKDWTIADFFSAPTAKLFTYFKYISELHEKGKSLNLEIQWYSVNGINLWAYKKDGDLPFTKLEEQVQNNFSSNSKDEESAPIPDDLLALKKKWMQEPEPSLRGKRVKSLEQLLPIAE